MMLCLRIGFLGLLVSLCGGCIVEDLPPRNVDVSTPLSVAVGFLQAIQLGDARSARGLSVGTPDEKKWVEARVAMVDGMRKFDNALYARFGRYTHQVHTDMHDSLLALADGPVDLIRNGTEAVSGNEARVDPKRKGFWSRNQTPVFLLKGENGWRVDIVKTYGGTKQHQAVSESFAQEQMVGDTFRSVAVDISAGRFGSIDEASKALAERLRDAFKN